MKKITTIAAAMLCTLGAFAQNEVKEVTYALPQTVIQIEVTAQQEIFKAAPYARYAKDLLGMDVILKDSTAFRITEVRINPTVEADQENRYGIILQANQLPSYLNLTSQGLVSGKEGGFSENGGWHFDGVASVAVKPELPAIKHEEPKVKKTVTVTPAEFEPEVIVVDRLTYGDSTSVADSVVVEEVVTPVDPEYLEAEAAARKILDLRDARYRIIIGDTDATYSGEALKAAVDELRRMEEDLLPLFVGTTSTATQKKCFEVIPEKDEDEEELTTRYTAFNFSESEGILAPSKNQGKTYKLVVDSEQIALHAPQIVKNRKPVQTIRYRIPAICHVSLVEGRNTILELRMPIYQLGIEEDYPIFN